MYLIIAPIPDICFLTSVLALLAMCFWSSLYPDKIHGFEHFSTDYLSDLGSWAVIASAVSARVQSGLIGVDLRLANGDELGQTLSRGSWAAHIIFMGGFLQSGGSAPSGHLRRALSC